MKVSGRAGAVGVHGAGAPTPPSGLPRLPRPAPGHGPDGQTDGPPDTDGRRAGPGARGGARWRGVAASRAQAGRVTWAPGRPRRSSGPVRPGRARKVSSLQVSINGGTNEPFRPLPPAEKVREVGSERQACLRSPSQRAALFDFQRAGEALLTCSFSLKSLGEGWRFFLPLRVCGCIKSICQPLNSRK